TAKAGWAGGPAEPPEPAHRRPVPFVHHTELRRLRPMSEHTAASQPFSPRTTLILARLVTLGGAVSLIASAACAGGAGPAQQGGVTTIAPTPTSKEDRIDFTRQLREQLSLTPAEIKGLQFYLSKPITLTRELSSGERTVSHGKLVTKDGKQVEEVDVLDG